MRPLLMLALVLSTAAPALVAQGPSISARQTSGIRGVVIDSLITGKVLGDAEVYIEGTERVAHSDARGLFAFDNLKPGRYTLGFSHLALDSLRLTAPTKVVDVPTGGGVISVTLSTPSVGALHLRACGVPAPLKAGLVMGVVKDADADTAVAGVEVAAEWTAIILQRGLRSKPELQQSHATTDGAGRYVLCGVPTDVPVALRTSIAGRPTTLIQLEAADQGIALRNLTVSMGDLAAMSTAASTPDTTGVLALTGTAQLTGEVRGEGGVPLVEAEVRVLAAATPKTKTIGDGSFLLAGLPAGSQALEVKALGYAPYRTWTDLKRGKTVALQIQMTKMAVVLNTVETKGYSTLFDRSGFAQRMKSGMGHYITDDDIRQRNPVKLEDVFRGDPSVQLISAGFNGYAVIFARAQAQSVVDGNAACFPNYFVDGSPYHISDYDISDGLPWTPQDIKGIELYPSPSNTPPQFSTLDGGCGTVVIWTKRGAPNRTFAK